MDEQLVLNGLLGSGTDFKSCCTNFYENDLLQLVLGKSFHPGGMKLTNEIGNRLDLKPGDKVLDVGAGLGSSALFLAKEFGSNVIGLDLSLKNTEMANKEAKKQKLDHLCHFQVGDAEKIPFKDESFDAVISECSFCIFLEKITAASEMYRVLKTSGKICITDVSVEKELPIDVQQMVFRIACIADALPSKGYVDIFEDAGFNNLFIIDKKDVVYELANDIKKKLFLAEIAKGLKRIDFGNIDLKLAKLWLNRAIELVDDGYGSYILLTGIKDTFETREF
ncbi:MAG: class I SAM-dependent methyltransferase [Candidatus Hodarchaeales archaeon]|jgi:ubiquinone/menaquinone biosynthesis C-methylase UbiE